jgi:hypothetical protein
VPKSTWNTWNFISTSAVFIHGVMLAKANFVNNLFFRSNTCAEGLAGGCGPQFEHHPFNER